MRTVVLLVAVVPALLVAVAPAGAQTRSEGPAHGRRAAAGSTFVGDTFYPIINCAAPRTLLQEASAFNQYVVPFSGVITEWAFESSAEPPEPTLKLKVARSAPGGAGMYTIVGESEPMPPDIGNTRISVQQGDIIGLGVISQGDCFRSPAGAPGYSMAARSEDVPPGATAQFTAVPDSQLDVVAVLEPDADNDGFGDLTQDQCPGVPGQNNGCPGAAATVDITKHPPKKDDDNTAKFKFVSDIFDPNATFECSVNDGTLKSDPFEPCTSPQKVKVKDGKHTFKVRAVVNGVPGPEDSFKWKVVPNDGSGHG
jgi:hypothetical protein